LLPKLHIYPVFKVEIFFIVFLSIENYIKFSIERFWYISCEANRQEAQSGPFICIGSCAFKKLSLHKKCGRRQKMGFSVFGSNQLLYTGFKLSINSY